MEKAQDKVKCLKWLSELKWTKVEERNGWGDE